MIKYGYLVLPGAKRNRYVTVAVDRPGKEDPEQVHTAAFAFCCPKDMFSKARGRKITEGRLREKKGVVQFVHNGTLSKAIECALQTAITSDGEKPEDCRLIPPFVARAIRRNKIIFGLGPASRPLIDNGLIEG